MVKSLRPYGSDKIVTIIPPMLPLINIAKADSVLRPAMFPAKLVCAESVEIAALVRSPGMLPPKAEVERIMVSVVTANADFSFFMGLS
jgi:hypothetical protein